MCSLFSTLLHCVSIQFVVAVQNAFQDNFADQSYRHIVHVCDLWIVKQIVYTTTTTLSTDALRHDTIVCSDNCFHFTIINLFDRLTVERFFLVLESRDT